MGTNAKGGLKLSGVEFLNYRIGGLTLESGNEMSLSLAGIPESSDWRVNIGVSDVVHYSEEDFYVSRVFAEMALLTKNSDGSEDPQEDETPPLRVSGTIYGVFRIPQDTELSPDMQEKILLNQTPAILLPFLRAAISGMLALAGYGAIPMPLINMAHLAETTPRKIVKADALPA